MSLAKGENERKEDVNLMNNLQHCYLGELCHLNMLHSESLCHPNIQETSLTEISGIGHDLDNIIILKTAPTFAQ